MPATLAVGGIVCGSVMGMPEQPLSSPHGAGDTSRAGVGVLEHGSARVGVPEHGCAGWGWAHLMQEQDTAILH